MRRQQRARQLSNAIWLVAMIACGLLVGGYILAHQRINWPTWVPAIGQGVLRPQRRAHAAPGVLPGQGQAVTISGVPVGEIGEVVRDGIAVLAPRHRREHFAHVHPRRDGPAAPEDRR